MSAAAVNIQNDVHADVGRLSSQLTNWLVAAAYPLWSTRGRDLVRGGFHERLTLDGEPTAEPRRARVQPRQAYAFSLAPSLGWQGPHADLILHGLDYLFTKYQRPDGLFMTLVDIDGVPLDRRALLYDQAFALLAFAGASAVSDLPFDADAAARRLRTAIVKHFARPAGGYETAVPPCLPLQSNPHMHLFEALLAWTQVSADPYWKALASDIAELAISRFLHQETMRELFDASWQPATGIEGRIVEPGHQFEWACLLLRWTGSPSTLRQSSGSGRTDGESSHIHANCNDACHLALRLIDLGERFGVRDGVAINTLLDDFSIHDASARLWPQAERLKAAAMAARITGEERYWQMARDAAMSLVEYLATPVAGLWYDLRMPSGEFVSEPSPASSLYHIVTACAELRSLVAAAPTHH